MHKRQRGRGARGALMKFDFSSFRLAQSPSKTVEKVLAHAGPGGKRSYQRAGPWLAHGWRTHLFAGPRLAMPACRGGVPGRDPGWRSPLIANPFVSAIRVSYCLAGPEDTKSTS